MWSAGRDLSLETCRWILNETLKDNWGSAIPYVQDNNYQNDIAIRKYDFQQGERKYQAAGPIKTFETLLYPQTQNLKTFRLSAKERDRVCNKWGQRDVINNLFISDSSQFTSGGADNSTLSLGALAIRQVDCIARQKRKKPLNRQRASLLGDKHVFLH